MPDNNMHIELIIRGSDVDSLKRLYRVVGFLHEMAEGIVAPLPVVTKAGDPEDGADYETEREKPVPAFLKSSADPAEAPRKRRARGSNGTETPASAPAPAKVPVPVDLSGSDDPTDEGDDDLGLPSTNSMTGQEAYDKSLGGIAACFNAGHKEPVYALRKAWKVGKFNELDPNQHGHALYKDVSAMLEKVGMHI